VNVDPFIEAEKVQQRNVKRACELLEVSCRLHHPGAGSRVATALVSASATGLSDRQADDAVRGRIDWEYALAWS
jgi:hypothetical protein